MMYPPLKATGQSEDRKRGCRGFEDRGRKRERSVEGEMSASGRGGLAGVMASPVGGRETALRRPAEGDGTDHQACADAHLRGESTWSPWVDVVEGIHTLEYS